MFLRSAQEGVVHRAHAWPSCTRAALLKLTPRVLFAQVEDQQLKDYEGDYAEYLRKNRQEASIMAAKEADQRERDKSQIKAKSKVGQPP